MDDQLMADLEEVQAERSHCGRVIATLVCDGVMPSPKLLDEFRQLTAQHRYLLERVNREQMGS